LREELGPQLYDEYLHNVSQRRTTKFCDDCLANQKRRGWFGKIECQRSTDEQAEQVLALLPESDHALARQAIDPVDWAEAEFGWYARWYQAQALRCTASWQTHRWGRRAGKSAFLGLKALHLAATKPGVAAMDPYTVLVVTPYQDQLEKLFQYMRDLIGKAKTLRTTRDIRDPHCIEFANLGKIIGFTAGEKTGARSDKIRGQDANAIIIDEADRIAVDDIDAVMAILASHKDCLLYFSTTPTGLPTRFRSACENPELGYKEFWIVSYESPDYTDRSDTQLKLTYPRETYEHEILAIFGTAEGGVFLPKQLKAGLREYALGSPLGPNERAIIGVDCNDPKNGTHAVVLGVEHATERARMLDKAVLCGEDFSKTKSEEMLVALFLKWRPILIAFDKGHAHGQIDDLSEWALHHPQSGMSEALKFYDLGSNYVYIDPVTNEEMNRPMKPLMVGITQNFLNESRLFLPEMEDVESGVVGQMRRFHVKRQGQDGRFIYSQGNEHDLTALMIALLSWRLEILGFEPMPTSDILSRMGRSKAPPSLPVPTGTRLIPNAAGKPMMPRAIGMRDSPSLRTQLDGPTRRTSTVPARKKF
jgi:hypothetical protein